MSDSVTVPTAYLPTSHAPSSLVFSTERAVSVASRAVGPYTPVASAAVTTTWSTGRSPENRPATFVRTADVGASGVHLAVSGVLEHRTRRGEPIGGSADEDDVLAFADKGMRQRQPHSRPSSDDHCCSHGFDPAPARRTREGRAVPGCDTATTTGWATGTLEV